MSKFDSEENMGNALKQDKWYNALKAFKGVSAEGGRKADIVWNLYENGLQPYAEGNKYLFKKK